eukprot:COSAG02_NODE_16895_length_1046_cov_562.121436_1_plen_104_part_01
MPRLRAGPPADGAASPVDRAASKLKALAKEMEELKRRYSPSPPFEDKAALESYQAELDNVWHRLSEIEDESPQWAQLEEEFDRLPSASSDASEVELFEQSLDRK